MYICLQLHYSVFENQKPNYYIFIYKCKALYDKIILTLHYFYLMLNEIEYQSTISMAACQDHTFSYILLSCIFTASDCFQKKFPQCHLG